MAGQSSSFAVVATRLPLSLVGTPSLISHVEGTLTLRRARDGAVIAEARVQDCGYRAARTAMLRVSIGGVTRNVFATAGGMQELCRRTVEEHRLPPVINTVHQEELLPDVGDLAGRQLRGNAEIRLLLPRWLDEVGVRPGAGRGDA